MAHSQQADISIYIHWPFCVSKCPYCDFNSHVMRSISEDEWVQAIQKELSHYRKITTEPFVKTIFFGGGTPSLMSSKAIKAVLDHIFSLWKPSLNQNGLVEITLEANPGTVDQKRFHDFYKAGVNRLSLGIQSLNDDALRFLGRRHDAKQALYALQSALDLFERVSFDLIYARQHQSVSEWEKELSKALEWKAEHLSLYQLTIEPGTAFQKRFERGELVLPDEDDAVVFYTSTTKQMEEAGFSAYEVSNYAKTGAECLHNLTYWHYQNYIGVGPGAHGRLHVLSEGDVRYQKMATQHMKSPQKWYKAVMDQQVGIEESQVLDLETQFYEQIMMGLRLQSGIGHHTLVRPLSLQEQAKRDELIAYGFLENDATTLRTTTKGRLVLNRLVQHLLT